MLAICVYDAVDGYQIQKLCIFLSKWNSKKVYARFFKDTAFKDTRTARKASK